VNIQVVTGNQFVQTPGPCSDCLA